MQEVIEDVQRIIHISKVAGAALDSFVDNRKVQLKAGIAMSNNHAIMCLELLDHYVTFWKQKVSLPPHKIEAIQKQNGERVIQATKGMFLFSLSGMEFSMKHALRINPDPLNKSRKQIKLMELIKESHKEKIISVADCNLWEGVINVRNSIVHNNGIWENGYKVYKYPNDLSISLKNQAMSQGNLRVFSQLTEWTLAAYLQWSVSLMLKNKEHLRLSG